ncbi:hypothetical protein GWI33_005781 [Rhynchophorus ferrugineus]|uniref:Uncharacterized protein n=1 Tax=Rhynchophorus ferrugineus TaxID=354439 RepID=A0A834ITY7_RHYFE|nr:hypothetical protein GWI33_005781 [Rhynchophorus ferrugineus]
MKCLDETLEVEPEKKPDMKPCYGVGFYVEPPGGRQTVPLVVLEGGDEPVPLRGASRIDQKAPRWLHIRP